MVYPLAILLWMGRILVGLGVAVWPVWGSLYVAGSAPSVAAALVAHLVLVIPGGMLIRRAGGGSPPSVRKRAGSLLILFGIIAWAPYFFVTEVSGTEISSFPFLIWHLSGVVPGALLRYTGIGSRWLPR